LDLLQEVATLHAEDAGDGIAHRAAAHNAWLLSRWRVRLGDLPRSAAHIQVTTQAYECRMALNRRCFALLDEAGRELAVGDSLWTLVNTDTGAPTNAAQVVKPYLEPGKGPDMSALPRRLQLPVEHTAGTPFPVTDDLLDTNQHVNNVRSVGLTLRYLPGDFAYSALAVDYSRPLLPGQLVTPLLAHTDRGFHVSLTVDGQICVSAEYIR
jgi:acyl-ACP thioesterase